MDEAKIVDLLWARAEQAIDALSKAFGRRLHHTAMNILNDPRDAEESVNDTYLAVWNAIPPRRPDPLSGFVYKTGRNIALNQLRANTARKRDNSYDLSLDELAGCLAGPGMDEALDARALGQAIDAFLDTLSKENRVLFLRRYWFGDSVKNIAHAAGLSVNVVSVRLSRTREKLKDHLMKEGFYHA